MNTLYLECSMGAAGDMLMSALYELLDDKESYLTVLNSLDLPGVCYEPARVSSCGIIGTQIHVKINGVEEGMGEMFSSHGYERSYCCEDSHQEHACHGHYGTDHDRHVHEHGGTDHDGHVHEHHSLTDIVRMIDSLMVLPEKTRTDAKAVYQTIARAESAVHGCEVKDIHFHEVGSLDAVADVIGVCYAINLLNPERIIVSPVHVGAGTVRCAHGIVPVPAPATAELLKDVPTYGGTIESELCTPTGAALLKYYANSFDQMPGMRTEKIGYGIGHKSFAQANCIRAFWGSTAEEGKGSILEIVSNIDDMTPEALAFASSRLMELGALDVYTVAGCFKKGRCGHVLTVLCSIDREREMVEYILRHTTSNGVRVRRCGKYFLQPAFQQVDTEYGRVQLKKSSAFGITHTKAEYEDLARIAREKNLPFQAVFESAVRCYGQL